MSNEKLLKEFVLVSEELKLLEKKKKDLAEKILQMEWREFECDGWKINKRTRKTIKLKEETSEEFIMEKFPEAISKSVNIKVLQKIPDAHDFLEMKESSFVQAKFLEKF